MANYLTSFDTYAAYTAATNLDLPNVSLILSDGSVYYKNLFAGASLGDILMWDVANQKLITTYGGNWNSTMYPIAQYEPIAINIYPAAQASDGKTRYMALKWVSPTSSTGSEYNSYISWGNDGSLLSNDLTALNGRENTDNVLTSENYSQSAFPLFYAVNQFHTNGTNQGDWYVPSKGELELYQANYTDINAKIEAIKNVSNSIVETVNGRMWTTTENSSNFAYVLYENWDSAPIQSNSCCRGVISL